MICRDIIGCCPRDYRRGSGVPGCLVSRYDGGTYTGLVEEATMRGKAWRTRGEAKERRRREEEEGKV